MVYWINTASMSSISDSSLVLLTEHILVGTSLSCDQVFCYLLKVVVEIGKVETQAIPFTNKINTSWSRSFLWAVYGKILFIPLRPESHQLALVATISDIPHCLQYSFTIARVHTSAWFIRTKILTMLLLDEERKKTWQSYDLTKCLNTWSIQSIN